MKRSTKGAIAAAGAATLLLGGAGTLAFWSDTVNAPGASIDSGHLRISDTTSCSAWTLDTGEVVNGATFTPGTTALVPGDEISRTCDVTLQAEGEHLRATVAATPGTNTGLFASGELDLAVSQVLSSPDGGTTPFAAVPGQEVTEANDGDTLRITTTVTFEAATTAANTQDVASSLADIALTVTQVHA